MIHVVVFRIHTTCIMMLYINFLSKLFIIEDEEDDDHEDA
jgi:hypothetical protein